MKGGATSYSAAVRRRVVPRLTAALRPVLAGVGFGLASLGLAAPALADPPEDTPVAVRVVPSECEGFGRVDVVASGGASVWIGDQHYLLASIDYGGGNVHDYGNRAGFDAEPIFCRSLSGSGITAMFVAVPGP
jgi:hypothetical protein